jgi:AraC family transcriptional regulator
MRPVRVSSYGRCPNAIAADLGSTYLSWRVIGGPEERDRRIRLHLSMAPLRSSCLLDSPLVQVFDVCCETQKSAFGADRSPDNVQIVLPRRGIFLVERRHEVTAVDTNSLLILDREEHYRFSHPVWGGHDSTILVLPYDLLATAFGGDHGFHGVLRPADQLLIYLTRRMLADDVSTQLEAEEGCMYLLQRLVEVVPTIDTRGGQLGPGQRLRVQRARALLASEPSRRWTLASLARAMDSSPFHLAREFRSITGETISRYVLRLRLAIALQRLADGESNLMKLAGDLGFAHHSHFSARFRSVFRETPSQVRRTLTAGGMRELATSALGTDALLREARRL